MVLLAPYYGLIWSVFISLLFALKQRVASKQYSTQHFSNIFHLKKVSNDRKVLNMELKVYWIVLF